MKIGSLHLILISAALLCFPFVAKAITLTDPVTGLTIEAPKGFSLSSNNGVYTLKKGKLKVKFIGARSPLSLTQTVASYIKSSKIKVSKRTNKKKLVRLDGQLGGKTVVVTLQTVGEITDIVTYSGSAVQNRKSTGTPKTQAVTAGEIIQLSRILASRRGGITRPLQVAIPMRRFVAPDGGSSALVPNLPGWTFQGGGGVISGFNTQQGVFALGIPVVVSLPGFGGSPPISNFVLPGQAIVSIWPQYAAVTSGAQLQVLNVFQVAGTDGWLGPNFLSGLYNVRVLINGRPFQALFLSGVFDMGSSIGYGWYHSYIAVPENGPGGIGAALFDTWVSWDNSVASQQRLAQALATVLTTRVQGGPIDPEVFERAANAWSAYIRE